jgi:hypothetical protein
MPAVCVPEPLEPPQAARMTPTISEANERGNERDRTRPTAASFDLAR